MARTARTLPNYTYLEYAKWDGRWEIIDGIPHAMTPMPSPRQQAISGHIHAAFLHSLMKSTCSQYTVYQPIDVKINDHTVVNPDLLIACEPIHGQYIDFAPDLVVEILSPSTD